MLKLDLLLKKYFKYAIDASVSLGNKKGRYVLWWFENNKS